MLETSYLCVHGSFIATSVYLTNVGSAGLTKMKPVKLKDQTGVAEL